MGERIKYAGCPNVKVETSLEIIHSFKGFNFAILRHSRSQTQVFPFHLLHEN